jgi:exosome complex protein LRP1
MDLPDIEPLLEELTDNIEDLEDALRPMLSGPLIETAGKLPMLDRAKLNTLTAYSILSITFGTQFYLLCVCRNSNMG